MTISLPQPSPVATPLPWRNPPPPDPGQEPPPGGLFTHGDGRHRPEATVLSSTTRYLAAACYVDDGFADRVTDEVVADSHRAVVPAVGYDLEAVVRHAFHARGRFALQNALLSLVLAGFLAAAPGVTAWVFGCLLAARLPGWMRRQRGRWRTRRVLLALVLIPHALYWVAYPLLLPAQREARLGFHYGPAPVAIDPYGGWPYGQSPTGFFSLAALLAVTLLGILTWSRYRVIETVTTELAPGRTVVAPRVADRDVEHRLAIIREAQHGNVLLHSGFNPFLGAGAKTDAWSIALELRPDQASRDAGHTGTVPVDPVELVGHIRRRLAGLRSHDLPEQERMTGLQLRDQIVAGGARWHGYPLIDQQRWLPYSHATQAAVDAIIRFPQTSARHFLRASVGAQEKPATAPDGQTIMPSEHQSVVATTLTHVAVEGAMLYIEVVESVLGPLRQHYLDIDRYALSGDPILRTALNEAWTRLAGAVPLAAVRLLHAARRRTRMNASMRLSAELASRELVHDFGARAETRELGSRDSFATYLQKLDSEKYLRLISKRITESVVEFLTEHGIDASEYQRVVNLQQYTNVTIGDTYGPTALGPHATASAGKG